MHFLATLLARPEAADPVRKLLAELAVRTRAEAGALAYEVLQDRDDPCRFQVVEHYRDEAAWADHMSAPYVQGALAAFESLLREPPVTSIWNSLTETSAAHARP
jgi:quinol monooxygenase YgiN